MSLRDSCAPGLRLSALLLLTLLPGLLSHPAWSQPGSVVTHQKISDTEGGFTEPLAALDEFGGAMVSLGDLDGPGPSVVALAVGAAGDDDGGTDHGAVYVLFLSGSGAVLSYQKISDTAGNFLEPLGSGDGFGTSVASLGDLDGAGPSVLALAVGAAGDDDGGTDRGAVYVLFLAGSGNVLSYQKISDTAGNFLEPLSSADEFGGAVVGLGDLDGAGPSAGALVAGAIGDDDGGTDRGAVYVLFLGASGSVISYQKISDIAGNFAEPLGDVDEFGSSVAALGDLDGGGPSPAAVAVGAIGDDDGGTDRGAVYVLFLGASGSVLSYQKISDTAGNFAEPLSGADEFGGAVAGLGDLDGAGPSAKALAVGAIGDDDGGTDRGAVYVLYLAQSGLVLSYQKISHTAGNFSTKLGDGDEFGGAVAHLGDLDGPGGSAGVLASGAAFDDDGGTDRGATYVLFLAPTPVLEVPDPAATTGDITLGAGRPNPFESVTRLPFRIARAARVAIEVFDLGGRLARRLGPHRFDPGEHELVWDGRDDAGTRLDPGTYFYRLSVDGRPASVVKRAVLVR